MLAVVVFRTDDDDSDGDHKKKKKRITSMIRQARRLAQVNMCVCILAVLPINIGSLSLFLFGPKPFSPKLETLDPN